MDEARRLREQTKQFVISEFLRDGGGEEGERSAVEDEGSIVGVWQAEPEVRKWGHRVQRQIRHWFM